MSNAQTRLPGFEQYFTPSYQWHPKPHTLEKIKSYFLGYVAHGRQIFPKRETIARACGIAVRTLARYLAYLDAEGWLKTLCKKAYTAIRQVFISQPTGPAAGPAIKVNSQGTEGLLRTEVFSPLEASVGETSSLDLIRTHSAAVKRNEDTDVEAPGPVACEKPGKKPSAFGVAGDTTYPIVGSGAHDQRSGAACESTPGLRTPCERGQASHWQHPDEGRKVNVTGHQNERTSPIRPSEPDSYYNVSKKEIDRHRSDRNTPAKTIFDSYYQTFVDAGVALNEIDRMRACREWVSLHPDDQAAAVSDAVILCSGRKACFIPLPVNHLRSRAWTRVAKPTMMARLGLKPKGFLRALYGAGK